MNNYNKQHDIECSSPYNKFLRMMKKTGIPKHIIILFIPFLFHSCNGNKNEEKETIDSEKITNCQYVSEVELLGNKDCTQMFCRTIKAECTYKNGEKKKHGLVCLALKDTSGNYTCPKAYDCAISKTPEYDEYIQTKKGSHKNAKTASENTFFNDKCDGVVTWEQGGIKL